MVTEVQGRASAKYRKEKVRQFNVKFFFADSDIYQWLGEQSQKNQFIKELIKADMERKVAKGGILGQ